MITERLEQRIAEKIAGSMLFRTLTKLFENEFQLPLFLESNKPDTHRSENRRMPLHQASLCRMINSPHASCARCPAKKLPPLNSLAPWVWTRNCEAGLAVTFAPVHDGRRAAAWLVTGHVRVEDGALQPPPVLEQLPRLQSLKPGELSAIFHEVRKISAEEHRAMSSGLQSMGELIGASINGLLIQDDPGESPWLASCKKAICHSGGSDLEMTPDEIGRFAGETGMTPSEYWQRCEIEIVRKTILARRSESHEIRRACLSANFPRPANFIRAFHACFQESPAEHRERMRRAQTMLARSLTLLGG